MDIFWTLKDDTKALVDWGGTNQQHLCHTSCGLSQHLLFCSSALVPTNPWGASLALWLPSAVLCPRPSWWFSCARQLMMVRRCRRFLESLHWTVVCWSWEQREQQAKRGLNTERSCIVGNSNESHYMWKIQVWIFVEVLKGLCFWRIKMRHFFLPVVLITPSDCWQ